MSRIHILSPLVANQIAAGEVVDRPSSVLKEALENSLDAGSTQIDVVIKRGGIGLIQVQDNGCGICKEDLNLALMQHATSKIINSEDLEGVLSLGFRGEALASISAVSKTILSSRTEESEYGWSIQKDGRIEECSLTPVSLALGTRLEIKDLFYNTPARRKFLKSEKTEWGHIQETFRRIALSHPEVAFTLSEGDRLYKRLPSCTLENIDMHAKRLAALCGTAFMNHAFYIEAENNGLILKGWLGEIETTRAQPDIQYFYVNGRIVRDKMITHAIKEAYANCPKGRYPAYVLYFECDPKSVDVNVHPTKYEVRFREARTIHAFLNYSIQEGLNKGGRGPIHFSSEFEHMPIKDYQDYDHHYDYPEKNKTTEAEWDLEIKPLSLLGGEFLLAENKEGGLWIADIKAIRYQWTLKTLQEAYRNQTLFKKPLIIPKIISIGKEIASASFMEHDWASLGFEFDEIGPEELSLRAVPELLSLKIENLGELVIALLNIKVFDVNLYLEKIAHYASIDSDFSTMDALELLKELNVSNSSEQYKTLHKQISIETLRGILYKL